MIRGCEEEKGKRIGVDLTSCTGNTEACKSPMSNVSVLESEAKKSVCRLKYLSLSLLEIEPRTSISVAKHSTPTLLPLPSPTDLKEFEFEETC